MDEEIKKTRIGGFGSSDAQMILKIAKNGCLNDADKNRIAIMLSLKETTKFSTFETEYGKEVEEKIFEFLKISYPHIVSNPYYKSEILSNTYGFDIFNHIDYEVEDKENLIWFENKATIENLEETEKKYKAQLLWHWFLGTEKAKKLNKKFSLILSHYYIKDKNYYFDLFNLNKKEIIFDCKNPFLKGFEVIQKELPSFEFVEKEEISDTLLPEILQSNINFIFNSLIKIKEYENKIEIFKQQLLDFMEFNNIKSINNDFLKITVVGATVSNTFDSTKFKKDFPELSEKYNKSSNKKSYLKITLKN